MSRFLRLALQCALLATGAWLVIGNELSPGAMIASTLLAGRALAPVDQAISSWRAAKSAWAAYQQLHDLLSREPAPADVLQMPSPSGLLQAENVMYGHDPAGKPVLSAVSFRLTAGSSLGIIGPTGSAKSTLARLLVGNLRPRLGSVRLDGLDVYEWEGRGRHIGYVPQDGELFPASVHENIARMGARDDVGVVEAARRAGVHELIVRLPRGYDTRVGEGGITLSPGQRQRIVLARALYGRPSLVVLDEPNAHLDQEGSNALSNALATLQEGATTVVLITHDAALLERLDYLLVLTGGKVTLSGPAGQVLGRLTGRRNGTHADAAR